MRQNMKCLLEVCGKYTVAIPDGKAERRDNNIIT